MIILIEYVPHDSLDTLEVSILDQYEWCGVGVHGKKCPKPPRTSSQHYFMGVDSADSQIWIPDFIGNTNADVSELFADPHCIKVGHNFSVMLRPVKLKKIFTLRAHCSPDL